MRLLSGAAAAKQMPRTIGRRLDNSHQQHIDGEGRSTSQK